MQRCYRTYVKHITVLLSNKESIKILDTLQEAITHIKQKSFL